MRTFNVFVGEDMGRPLRDAAALGAHALNVVDYHIVPYIARRRCRLGSHVHDIVVVAWRLARYPVGSL